MHNQQLLSVSNDAKTVKGEKFGYITHVLYLAAGNTSGHEVCHWRNDECFKVCLYNAGRGKMHSVQNARIQKTKRYFLNKKKFISDLMQEIESTSKKAQKKGYIPIYRLDGTSDLGLAQRIAPKFPNLQFYDYTKNFKRKPLANWDITYSYDGFNWNKCKEKLSGVSDLKNVSPCSRVAMVFKNKLPKTYKGYKVVDGDNHDLRFLDKKNIIIGLKIKGKKSLEAQNFFVDIK